MQHQKTQNDRTQQQASSALEDLQYPIGKFRYDAAAAVRDTPQLIATIAALPQKVESAVAGLSPWQLDTPYRDGGWTLRQVVHHLPDSHGNGYTRTKLALTEQQPLIKPYDEAAWARLAEAQHGPVGVSLQLLQALHVRWVSTWRGMNEAEFSRTFRHPELGLVPLRKQLALYAWHGDHHLHQILGLKQRLGW
jgi:hypothetical protein